MDKNKCSSCGEAPHKCSCKNKEFTKAVIEIDNPEQITLMRRVVIPASMGDDTTVPPVVGKYKNVLLFYEANSKSYLYSSDGIPTLLANGLTDYEQAVNLPEINGNTLIGDKTGEELGLQDKLTAGDNITIEDNVISATDTTYGPATDTEIGLVKPGEGLEVDTDGTLSISDIEQYAHVFDTVADMKAATNLVAGDYARTLGFHTINDGGGALYHITDTGTADEMYIIAIGDLYANLIIQDYITPEVLGAYGDGTHDDKTPLQECLSNTTYRHSVLSKVYHITSPVAVANNKIVDGGGTIDSTDACILLDGSAHITIRDLYLLPTTYGVHLRTNNTWINYINFEDIDINGYTHSATCALYIEPTSYYINEVHYTNCKLKNCQYGVYAKNDNNKDMAQHYFINCSVEGSSVIGIYIKEGSYFNFINCRHTESNSSKWKTEGSVTHLLILGGNVAANTSTNIDFSNTTYGEIVSGLRFAGIYANTPCTNAQIVAGVIVPDKGAIMHSRYNVSSNTTMTTTGNIYYMFNFNTDAEVTLTLPAELYGGQGKYNQFFVRVQANQTHNSIVKVGDYFTKTLASTGSVKYYRFDYSEFSGAAGWLVEAIDTI